MSDNAGGGIRGLRAEHSQALLDAVLPAYDIEISAEPVDLGGSSSLNLRLAGQSDKYVLRVYRPYVTPARLAAIQSVRHQLSLAGIPCNGLVSTKEGRPWMVFNGRLLELERYIEHDAEMDTWEALETGMPVLARIHAVLGSITGSDAARHPLFTNHIESSQVLTRTALGTQRIRAWNPSRHEQRLADAAGELAQRVFNAESGLRHSLANQLVHGDFWDNNVFLRDGEVVFVLDWDFMGERPRIDDLALTLYFICMEFFQTPVSNNQLVRLRGLLDAYDRGSDKPLDAIERAALPLAMARQPLWSIGSWVALLDDEDSARQHALDTFDSLKWALGLMDEVERWQDSFSR